MKRILIATALILSIGVLAMAQNFDSDSLNLVTFTNGTGNAIEYIFLSPGDSEYWGPEILGLDGILESGDSLGFYLYYPDECNDFDIMTIDEDGNTAIIYDYTVCDGEEEEIEIVEEDMTEDPPEGYDLVTIYVENDTIELYYVFISPSDSVMWGVDYLDERTTLDTGDEVGFLFPVWDEESTEYDLMAVDSDFDTYTLSFEVDYWSDEETVLIEISDLD